MFFQNEEGLDAGGIRKEFFLLLTKAILNPQYGMFSKFVHTKSLIFLLLLVFYDETNTIWFSEHAPEEETMYKLIGVSHYHPRRFN